MKQQADDASSTMNKASNKVSGNTEVSGDTLYIHFNAKKLLARG
ncbi:MULTISPECIES: hypothetical protein [Pseudomonas]|nr:MULTISPECIES: hypothetical protein [Pseudomonas]